MGRVWASGGRGGTAGRRNGGGAAPRRRGGGGCAGASLTCRVIERAGPGRVRRRGARRGPIRVGAAAPPVVRGSGCSGAGGPARAGPGWAQRNVPSAQSRQPPESESSTGLHPSPGARPRDSDCRDSGRCPARAPAPRDPQGSASHALHGPEMARARTCEMGARARRRVSPAALASLSGPARAGLREGTSEPRRGSAAGRPGGASSVRAVHGPGMGMSGRFWTRVQGCLIMLVQGYLCEWSAGPE
jgi:hypothetical protein